MSITIFLVLDIYDKLKLDYKSLKIKIIFVINISWNDYTYIKRKKKYYT